MRSERSSSTVSESAATQRFLQAQWCSRRRACWFRGLACCAPTRLFLFARFRLVVRDSLLSHPLVFVATRAILIGHLLGLALRHRRAPTPPGSFARPLGCLQADP